MEDSIIRKVDKIVNRGDDITVCLPGSKIEDIAEKAEQVMGGGTGGAVHVHVGTNNVEKEGTSAIVGKCRRLIKTFKEARIGQIVLSWTLPIGGRGEEYRTVGGRRSTHKYRRYIWRRGRIRRHMVKLCGKR